MFKHLKISLVLISFALVQNIMSTPCECEIYSQVSSTPCEQHCPELYQPQNSFRSICATGDACQESCSAESSCPQSCPSEYQEYCLTPCELASSPSTSNIDHETHSNPCQTCIQEIHSSPCQCECVESCRIPREPAYQECTKLLQENVCFQSDLERSQCVCQNTCDQCQPNYQEKYISSCESTNSPCQIFCHEDNLAPRQTCYQETSPAQCQTVPACQGTYSSSCLNSMPCQGIFSTPCQTACEETYSAPLQTAYKETILAPYQTICQETYQGPSQTVCPKTECWAKDQEIYAAPYQHNYREKYSAPCQTVDRRSYSAPCQTNCEKTAPSQIAHKDTFLGFEQIANQEMYCAPRETGFQRADSAPRQTIYHENYSSPCQSATREFYVDPHKLNCQQKNQTPCKRACQELLYQTMPSQDRDSCHPAYFF